MLLATSATAVAQDDTHSLVLLFDFNSAAPSTDYTSWLDGGLGKLCYDEEYSGVGIGRFLVEYRGRVSPSLTAHVVGDYVDDGGGGADLTEAYLEWRPIPQSANRHSLKVGAFYPEISLENGDTGWASPFAISSSAINTWVGEELRTIGAEWSMERPLGASGSAWKVKPIAALYYGNDPIGTLLSWKGWALHDRQTRLNDVLPLPPLPQVGPSGIFQNQAVRAEPFIETDDRPGYYFGTEFQLRRRALIAVMHYDIHADPMSIRDGQYGWITRFDHVGSQVELPRDSGLVVQWLRGTTAMGPFVNGARVVDVGFDSYFLLLTKRVNQHRMSIRFDDFDVTDRDYIPLDDSSESGHAWTVAYRFDYSERLNLKLEWLQIENDRPSHAYFGRPVNGTERIVQLQVGLKLGDY
jgi:hypothetical protein